MKSILSLNIKELETYFSNEILGHSRPGYFQSKPEGLYRIRKINNSECEECDKKLSYTNSIWYRDWSKVDETLHTYNRCSTKGQNFFYSSNSIETAVKEVNPNNGDILLIGIFKLFPKNNLLSQFAGIETLKNNHDFREILSQVTYNSDRDKKIEFLISRIFEHKTLPVNEYYYRFSIAFSNILLKNEEIECIIYPSVANNYKSSNYGIKPDAVDKKLYCENTFIYKYQKNCSSFDIVPIKFGVPFEKTSHPKFWNLKWGNYTSIEIKNNKKTFKL